MRWHINSIIFATYVRLLCKIALALAHTALSIIPPNPPCDLYIYTEHDCCCKSSLTIASLAVCLLPSSSKLCFIYPRRLRHQPTTYATGNVHFSQHHLPSATGDAGDNCFGDSTGSVCGGRKLTSLPSSSSSCILPTRLLSQRQRQ
jgi:hypothetical protein